MRINILCIGDVVGKAGRNMLAEHLPRLIREHQLELVVCNAENAAGGSGLTPQILNKLFNYGVDVVTLGDHCFRKADILQSLETSDRLIRPANISRQAVGRGWTAVETKSGNYRAAVTVLLGQMSMGNNDSPWATADQFFRQFDDTPIRVVDFHGEATSEKIAMGWHCNGRAGAVFGTHTHVPTADARVLDGGTAFICDLGMTGPYDSILGRRKDRVLKFLTTAMPQRFEVATGDPRLYGLLVELDSETGKASSAELIAVFGEEAPGGPYDGDDTSLPQRSRSRNR
jgi:hypothetical protein